METKAFGPNIEIKREISRNRIVEGDELRILLKIRNKSDQTSNILELQDFLPPDL